ncbi:MAG: hypothetical protein HKN31_12085, partial [Pricia sp.]|nr:hypothetical protein [Pricia sp.]
MKKTYYLIHAALALIIIGCSNSNDVSNENFEEEESVTANYTLLLEEDGLLTAQLLNADADKLSINTETSDFISVTKPTLTFEEGQVLSMFLRHGDCSAEITVHNFETSVSKTYSVFSAMETCSFTEKAIAYTSNTLYIAYEVEITSSISEYFIRIVDISKSEPTWVDVPLLLKPVELAIANNRLFILTLDEELTGEHGISILNLATSSIIHEMLIGFDAHRIFRNPDKNIIISYEELHTTLNSSTFAVQYTNYG